MADFTVQASPQFPVGSTVDLYVGSAPAYGAPWWSPLSTGHTVSALGTVAFTGLEDGTRYFLYALVGGEHRYISFRTDDIDDERYEVHTWAVGEDVAAGTLPGMWQAKAPSGTLRLVKMSYGIQSGTSADVKLQKNGVDIAGSDVTATTTPASTALSGSAADGDEFRLVVTAVSGSPQNLSVSAVFDRTVA